jgi:hypothetical protein
MYLALAACGAVSEPHQPSLVDTSAVLACEDPTSFRATLAGADTTAFVGCAMYSVNPDGWMLTLLDGPSSSPRYTLTLKRGARPLPGSHSVGDQTGITNPRFTALLTSKTRNFAAADGSVQVLSSSEGYVQGTLQLGMMQSGGGSYTLTGSFEATCGQRPTLGC